MKYLQHPLTRAFLLLITLTGSLFLASYLVNKFDATRPTPNEVGPKVEYVVVHRPSCEWKSKDSFAEMPWSLTFAEGQKTYGIPKGPFVNLKSYEIKTEGKDEFNCGYVRVTMSKGGKPTNPLLETPFIAPQEFGGHLALQQALYIEKTDTATIAYFPLRSVPYFEGQPFDPRSKDYNLADWANLLNVNSRVTFQVALNTSDPQGKIESITIAYKCWNPDTGKDGSDCALGIEK